MSINILVRPLDIEQDLDGAIRCFNEGFEHILWPSIEHAAPSLHRDYVKFFYKMSTDFYAAEVDGEVFALLFGAAPVRISGLLNAFGFYLFYMVPKALINGYKMNWLAYKHFFRLFYGYLPIFLLHSRWPIYEVMLFTSRKQYRSRGLGRKLMDAFVETVRKRGNDGTAVSTDTALAYRFYEAYGFKLEKEFAQRGYKYSIRDKSFKARFYYYTLEK
jgi:ribosomal protein S18 acetylase RimI-like enzyme